MSEKKASLLAAIFFYVIALIAGVVFRDSLQNISLFIGCFIGVAVMHFLNYRKIPKIS
ncbi:hypothetical protein [Cytobacillus sp. Bac17]|uniref:hypothetical protein n=1 Tax=Cytobacillus sp. Bac17 TaxID=2926008 RepID=UPI002118B46A|nr:hypothetical protein [Cytobacillus sp. Bac17]